MTSLCLATPSMLLLTLVVAGCAQALNNSANSLLAREVKASKLVEDSVSHEVFLLQDSGDFVNFTLSGNGDTVHVCHVGQQSTVFKFWMSATFRVLLPHSIKESDFVSSLGPNVTFLKAEALKSKGSFRLPFLPKLSFQSPTSIRTSPFKMSCLELSPPGLGHTAVVLHVRRVDFYLVLCWLLGLSVFLLAPRLARSQAVFYVCGVSLGVSLSLLLLVYLVQKKAGMSGLTWLVAGYSFSVSLLVYLWHSALAYTHYLPWLAGYVLASGLLSWAALYRWGPPHPRTRDIVQWLLRALGLAAVFFSSYQQQTSMCLVLCLLTWQAVPGWLKAKANTAMRKKLFPKQIKLLSEDEYNSQSLEETRRALDDLRRFCQSPESKPWRTVGVLKDPSRFADFMQGSPHVTEGEVMEYSTWDSDTSSLEETRTRLEANLTDDDSDEAANASFDGEH